MQCKIDWNSLYCSTYTLVNHTHLTVHTVPEEFPCELALVK